MQEQVYGEVIAEKRINLVVPQEKYEELKELGDILKISISRLTREAYSYYQERIAQFSKEEKINYMRNLHGNK